MSKFDLHHVLSPTEEQMMTAERHKERMYLVKDKSLDWDHNAD